MPSSGVGTHLEKDPRVSWEPTGLWPLLVLTVSRLLEVDVGITQERRVIISRQTRMDSTGPAGLNLYSMASVTSECRSPTYREAMG